MMKNKEILFNLIQKSFNNEVFLFESSNEPELLQMIIENGLVGLIYNVIDKYSFKNENYLLRLKASFNEYISKDIRQTHYINELSGLLKKMSIDHIFLKGTVLKGLYPYSYMRGMGDIDLLVRLDDFERSKTILESNDYKYLSATSHHHVYETIDHISIELHQSIISIVDYDNDILLKEVWSFIEVSLDHHKRLKPEFEYVYLLTHLIRHIRTSGIGIRSLIDIYVYLSVYSEKMDKTLLKELLKLTHSLVFHHKVQRINDIIFGNIKSEKKDDDVIDYLIFSGIHGKGMKHDSYITKKTHELTRRKKSNLGYFLSEVFPSHLALKEQYPYLKKHPYLLPYTWMVRIFKQLFRKPKDTKSRLKAITNNKDLSKVDEIYSYLGL